MATTQRPTVELERAGGRQDVLIVRRITSGRSTAIHGPSSDHWTMHFTLEGSRLFHVRGAPVTAETSSVVVYRRQNGHGGPTRATGRCGALRASFATGPNRQSLPVVGLEGVAVDALRAAKACGATRRRGRDAFA